MTPQIRLDNSRPIKLRRLLQFNNSTSIGVVLPRSFVNKMGLRAGEYMAIELNEERTGLTMNKCSVAIPGLTNAGEEEED